MPWEMLWIESVWLLDAQRKRRAVREQLSTVLRLSGMSGHPCRRSGLEMRVVGDEVVLLDVANGHVHRLNVTAGQIWAYCDGQTTLPEIAARLAGTYGMNSAEVATDVENAVRELTRLGLLTNSDG